MVDIYNQFKDFKSIEVAFVNEEKRLHKIYCSVKSIENNRIVLDANNQRNRNTFAKVGDDLKLNIYTESGVYTSSSKIILVTKGIINTEYVISYPAESKHSQRREYFRADLPIKIKVFIESENPSALTMHEGVTRNICGKGLSVLSNSMIENYKSIEIKLYFDEQTIETHAELVYTKQVIVHNKPKFVHAFMFTDIDKRSVDFIVKKCFLHQLELRKRHSS